MTETPDRTAATGSDEGGARLLLANAAGFHFAAQRIADTRWPNLPDGRTFFPWPPFFANLGYVFELSLKAYIVYHGGTEDDCRRLGHDLDRVFSAAKASHLQIPRDTAIEEVIRKIGPYHKDHSFRYLKDIPVEELPDVATALAAAQEIMKALGDQLPFAN